MTTPADQLRTLLAKPGILSMPGCHDALSARLVEQAGFETSFMSGFAVAASRLGLPDTGLISFAEMLDQGRNICNAVSMPMFGDGDTGFGNAVNVRRTVQSYAQAGFACIMLEDQVMPKRCGHTPGKDVVSRDEAYSRIQAAVDARNEGSDILIMARTDARAIHGLDEAIERANEFMRIGADITFVEAPESVEEMQAYCDAVPGYKMANLIDHGKTPVLPAQQLEQMGYKIMVFPLTMLSASISAMQQSLERMKNGQSNSEQLDFESLKSIVGFPDYYRQFDRYSS